MIDVHADPAPTHDRDGSGSGLWARCRGFLRMRSFGVGIAAGLVVLGFWLLLWQPALRPVAGPGDIVVDPSSRYATWTSILLGTFIGLVLEQIFKKREQRRDPQFFTSPHTDFDVSGVLGKFAAFGGLLAVVVVMGFDVSRGFTVVGTDSVTWNSLTQTHVVPFSRVTSVTVAKSYWSGKRWIITVTFDDGQSLELSAASRNESDKANKLGAEIAARANVRFEPGTP